MQKNILINFKINNTLINSNEKGSLYQMEVAATLNYF